MPPNHRTKNGYLELKYNGERTQVFATIYPPTEGGECVTTAEVMDRLKKMGVTYGIREGVILETVHGVDENNVPANAVMVAQGTLPQNGQDAKVSWVMPREVLAKPLPRRAEYQGLPDWFSLDPAKIVKADSDLAMVSPPLAGATGKTLTWPIQPIQPRVGKPCTLKAGDNVHMAGAGLRFVATKDGYACLEGDELVVYALRLIEDAEVVGGLHEYSSGAVLTGSATRSEIRAGGLVAIRLAARECRIRAHGDLYINSAEGCDLVATGNVYVFEKLVNCRVNTRKKLIALKNAEVIGGSICATEGVCAMTLGTPEFMETEVETGVDRISVIRSREIQEELAGCEANISKISQTLKPFASLAAHDMLTEDKKHLLYKLQMQLRSQEERIKELHSERRFLSITANEKIASVIVVAGCIYPGVWLRIRSAAMLVEEPMESLRFMEGPSGKSIKMEPLSRAA